MSERRINKRKGPHWNEESLGKRPNIKELLTQTKPPKNAPQQNNPTQICTETGSDQTENRSPDDRTTSLTPASSALSASSCLFRHSHQNSRLPSNHLITNNCSNGSLIFAPQINNSKAGGCFNLSVKMTGPQTASERNVIYKDYSLENVKEKNAATMKKRFQNLHEVTSRTTTQLNYIFVDVDIIEGETSVGENGVLEPPQGPTINFDGLFKPLPGQEKEIRMVMTKGDGGIGKTVIVQKFILDWADKLTHKHLDLVLSFPVRELTLLKDSLSLLKLVSVFHKELNDDTNGVINLNTKTTLIILDGLDESTLPLNFKGNPTLADETDEAPVDVLITNLLKGNLLPEARIWITSRPAAVKKIPIKYISRMTELHGFDDKKIKEYFMKKFSSNEDLGRQVFSHIEKTKSLWDMCHIPVFSCISAMVLENKITNGREHIPKTVTEMYIHFLHIQTNLKNTKYFDEKKNASCRMMESDKEIILKLAKLAFTNLEKGKFIFSDEDLNKESITVSDVAVHSGLCTEVLKKECGIYYDNVFCFVHMTVQEFFAALYLLNCFAKDDFEELRPFLIMEFVKQAKAESTDALLGYNSQFSEDLAESMYSSLEEESEELTNNLMDCESRESKLSSKKIPLHGLPLHVLLKSMVSRALKSENCHLNAMLPFLLGLSVEQNGFFLNGLLPKIDKNAKCLHETKTYITKCLNSSECHKNCINLLLCLAELGDHNLPEKAIKDLRADIKLTPKLCTALAYTLSMEPLDVFDLRTIKTTDKGRRRLLCTLSMHRKVILAGCNISGEDSYKMIGSALRSPTSALRDLNLSYNGLSHSSIRLLCDGLQSPNCKLEILCLKQCNLTAKVCGSLSKALEINKSLKELDLANNELQDSGVELFTKLPRLESLNLSSCGANKKSCASLSNALRCTLSQLKMLDLSDNDLRDTGIRIISKGLAHQNCKLQTLRLTGCLITEDSCIHLAVALRSNTCMQLLDVNYNYLGDTGLEKICNNVLQAQITSIYNNKQYLTNGKKKYACEMHLDPYSANDQLLLSEKDKMASWMDKKQSCHRHPVYPQVLCTNVLTDRHYWEVKWKGRGARVGVVYQTSTNMKSPNSLLGSNEESWILNILNHGRVKLSAWHNNVRKDIQVPFFETDKVGVYLEWLQGTLSFYRVACGTEVHLHTFLVSSFTGPLRPAFCVCPSPETSILLC